MIRTVLIGYGKMGKEIEALLKDNNLELIGVYDIDNPIQKNLKEKPDIAIEFTTPHTAIDNIKFLSENGINIVCGTTGWYNRIDEIKKIIEINDTGFIYASNFSIGVNIFFMLLDNAAMIMNKFENYDISIEETHHSQKLDKPSGTAIRAAEYLIKNIERKINIVNDKDRSSDNEINIVSKRTGNVVGNHKVLFDSEGDIITIEHNAKSRRGFAEGAILAAKYIYNRKGFFKFEDVFKNLI